MDIHNNHYQNCDFPVDKKGLPLDRNGEYDVGLVAHFALGYAGREWYNPGWKILPNEANFQACIDWLSQRLAGESNSCRSQDSGFVRAVVIQAFLEAYARTEKPADLASAEQEAARLVLPIREGGHLFANGEVIWFEGSPHSQGNLSHDLETHLWVLLALRELRQKVSGYEDIYRRGVESLTRRLKLYDSGDGILKSLSVDEANWQFYFANPYGHELTPVGVERLIFQWGDEDIEIEVGKSTQPGEYVWIEGSEWDEPEGLDDRVIRRLKVAGREGRSAHHFSVFFKDTLLESLGNDRLGLVIVYKDEMPGHVALRVRASQVPDDTRDLIDSGLLLSGSGRWMEWHLPLRLVDFGPRANRFTLEKIGDGLHMLSLDSPSLGNWATVIQGYGELGSGDGVFSVKHVDQEELPGQYDLSWGEADDKGVVRIARVHSGGGKQDQVYNVALIGHQALGMKDLVGSLIKTSEIKSAPPAVEPAYQWLADHMVSLTSNAVVWNYQFDHVYNDVVIRAPWQSAIGQAYVLRALQQAVLARRTKPPLDYEDMLVKGSRTYAIRTEDGGLQSINRFGNIFYEEVPNNTHILNAHLVSTLVLGELYQHSGEAWHRELFQQGLQTLRAHLYLYDTGYWLRYDLNPKKEILFQIDWIEGEHSPLISEILLINPQTGHATQLLAGQDVFQGQSFPCLSGIDWLAAEKFDDQWGRGFRNGYQVWNGPVAGGTRHNVYFWGALPDRSFKDYFDVPAHVLMVRYKDVSLGEFALKIQKINQGNSLSFAPLQDGIWRCNGDGSWKQRVDKVFPQDMGWYVGPEYQRYHIALLRSLAERTGECLFEQYAEQQAAHLEALEAELASSVPRTSDLGVAL